MSESKSMTLKGIGASPGIGVARAFILRSRGVEIPHDETSDVAAEMEHFESAYRAALEETKNLYEKTLTKMGAESAEIFDVHLTILNDAELIQPIREAIIASHCSAAWAIKQVADRLIALFSAMDDEYMRERATDIDDVTTRLIHKVMAISNDRLASLNERSVVVAYDLTPSDTVGMDVRNIAGIITAVGGGTSHAAIIARTLGIPAIVGVGPGWEAIVEGDLIALDGDKAEVRVNPDADEVAEFEKRGVRVAMEKRELEKYKTMQSVTTDGRRLEVLANIGTPGDLEHAIECGAEGVGLFRSEFLFMNRSAAPKEDEQFEAYREVVARLKGKPVTIRTLDIGGDKKVDYLGLAKEDNPFLGYRAIRLCLGQREIFKVQLRAMLRASAFGNLRIMFPMISSIQELRTAKNELERAKMELRLEKKSFDERVKVGIMVEIPAVAVIADLFARECDFFSIGTNDLIQYAVAVDRGNERIAALYTPYHPAVLRLIAMTATAAEANGIPCAMCGEAAGDPMLIPALIGLGLNELSMNANSILKARMIVSKTNYADSKSRSESLLSLPTSDEVQKVLSQGYERREECLPTRKTNH